MVWSLGIKDDLLPGVLRWLTRQTVKPEAIAVWGRQMRRRKKLKIVQAYHLRITPEVVKEGEE